MKIQPTAKPENKPDRKPAPHLYEAIKKHPLNDDSEFSKMIREKIKKGG